MHALGLDIKKTPPKPFPYPNDFLDIANIVTDRTLVTIDRCFIIYQYAMWAKVKEGSMAEVGVYKGGTAKIISCAAPLKKLCLFDTFEGMPDVNMQVDIHRKGDFNDTSIISVKNFLKDHDNIHYCPGLFPETVSDLKDERFCFVHIDVDIYTSVKDSLIYFYDRMVDGGVIVFDDYEMPTCPGVKKAITEFLEGKKEKPIVTTMFQCIVIRI